MDESDPTQNLDLHLTVLFQWLVRTAGASLAWLLGGILIGALATGLTEDGFWIGLCGLVGLVGFVGTLWLADAPLPYDVREPGE